VAGTSESVAAVLITRDRCPELLRTLARLRALPERPPIVVVDNGSRDETVRLVREQAPEATLLEMGANRGAGARNVGVQAAATPYVAFCDDDSWWRPGSLARAVELLEAHPRLALIAARILVGEQERLDPTCALMARSPLPGDRSLPGVPVLGFLACGAVLRRSAFLEVGGFHPRYGIGAEEQLLAIDLAAAGHRLAYVPDVVAHHHPQSGERPARRQTEVRDELWFAWLRRRPRAALARTARSARRATRDRHALVGLLRAAAGAPAVLRARRPVSVELERQLRTLEAQRGRSGAPRVATPAAAAAPAPAAPAR
jgi:GT2 family glycosyltransferase